MTATKRAPQVDLWVENYGGANPTDNDRFTGALEAAHAAGGGVVRAAPRTYDSLSALIYTNTILRGSGWKTILRSASSANPVLMLTDPVSGTVQGVGIENLVVDGVAPANGVTGIRWARFLNGSPVTSARTNYMKGVEVLGCAVGLQLVNDQGIDVSACRFESNAVGAKVSDNSELGTWTSCDFRYNSVAGLVLENSNAFVTPTSAQGVYGHKFTRCHWEANTGKGVVIDGAGNNTFDTCKWEQNNGTSVDQVIANSITRPDGNIFIDGIWNGNPGVPTAKHFNLDRGNGTLFFGGAFNPANTGGVVISSVANYTGFVGTLLNPSILTDGSGGTWWISPDFGRTRLPNAPNHLSKWVTNTGGTVELGPLPPFVNITNVRIQVTTAFDGTTPKISVGTSGNNTLFCTATDVSTTGIKAPVLGTMGYYDGVFQTVNAYYTGGANTTGRALVILEYQTVAARP